MAATVAEIRAGIAANLAAVFEPNVTVSAYMLDPVLPPVLQVMGMDSVSYDSSSHRGLDTWTFHLQGLGGPMSQGAQMVLDDWLNPTGALSVKAAVEAGRTLGGKVQDCWVIGASDYRLNKLSDATVLLGCEWQIRVLNVGA